MDAEIVAAELERILASAAFRNARRSQDFLRYVVTNALQGHQDELKERTIGVSVFQRPPDYDTGEDSIVRVKASELRKRLAQYYQEDPEPHAVRIELPAGAYVPEFRWAEAAVARPARRLSRWVVPAAATAVAAACAWLYLSPRPAGALDEFWQPVFRSPRTALLCVAHPPVYRLTGKTGQLLFLDPNAQVESIPAADLARDTDNYVGIGDAFALAQLAGFLSRKGKPVAIRMGNDVSFADLRSSPAVLIGAFTNQWTMEMTSHLRFVFDRAQGRPNIRDQMNPTTVWQRDPQRPNLDHVLLTRLFDSRTGDMIITAAGLAHAGTQMAGEFLTNPAYLEQAMGSEAPDWKRRNLQLVLTGEVIGKTAGPPRVAARWYW